MIGGLIRYLSYGLCARVYESTPLVHREQSDATGADAFGARTSYLREASEDSI
jgi:hypothetical protein